MRIVSLCPSITETLVALGLRETLVGVTRYCIHPRESLIGIPRVGGTKNPDLDAIRALRPDLVLANAEENRPADIEALSGDLRIDVSHPRNVPDAAELTRRLGRLTGRAEEGETWARRIEERLAAVRSVPRPAFRFAYLVWKDPWMLAGRGTYIDGLLSAFSGVNVAPGAGAAAPAGTAYPEVTEDALVALAPDWLFLPDEPYRFGEAHRAYWQALLPGVAVHLVSGDDLCWHGVRTLRGLDLLERLLVA
jgi:iron complex transport system substrate-binding protein